MIPAKLQLDVEMAPVSKRLPACGLHGRSPKRRAQIIVDNDNNLPFSAVVRSTRRATTNSCCWNGPQRIRVVGSRDFLKAK